MQEIVLNEEILVTTCCSKDIWFESEKCKCVNVLTETMHGPVPRLNLE